jgi:PAS domain S-box-containing protein
MDAILTIDRNQRIIVFNKAAEQIFRCTASEALGQSIDKFIPGRFRAIHGQHIQGFATTGVTARSMYSPGTLFALRADGEEFPIEAAISQVECDGEKLFTVILRDISARRRMEAELFQVHKMEAVGQLAGGIAHEFNNFLGVILGFSELLSEEAVENEKVGRLVTEIRAATQHAASLTRQLLAFSRKQVLEPQVLDINQSIWEGHKLLRRLVPANIDVVPVLARTIGRVRADAGQLQQILVNLVVNARDAMPQGGKVVIETADAELDETYTSQHVDLQPGSYVLLSVSDSGLGMNAETRSHLFEPFYTTKDPGKGTGLGLSTVYGIVKQSGGHISVESIEGKGTTFRIYLPRTQEATEESDIRTSRLIERKHTGPATILVVEDETALRRLICFSLEKRKHKVLAAKDGAEAFEIFRQHAAEIQLIVTDLMMPRMDGLELKQHIAASRPDVKFLFMSGYAEHLVDQHRGSLEGCAFLAKPFLPEELANKVSGLLSGDAAA